jgi:hypothetical protein
MADFAVGDNCPTIANATQSGLDLDGFGDPCDPETIVASVESLSSVSSFFDLTIAVGGTLTLDGPVAGQIEIQPGGRIDVTGRGVAGGPRLRDHDGDGLAQMDAGAFEVENTSLSPGDVGTLTWPDRDTVVWESVVGAVEYHLYRGEMIALAFDSFGDCRDDLDGVRTDTVLNDPSRPAIGTGWFYLLTTEGVESVSGASNGEEGTLGIGSFAERSNFAPCP